MILQGTLYGSDCCKLSKALALSPNSTLILGVIIELGLVVFFSWVVFTMLSSGKTRSRSSVEFSRKDQPLVYWTDVCQRVVLLLGSLWLLVRTLKALDI